MVISSLIVFKLSASDFFPKKITCAKFELIRISINGTCRVKIRNFHSFWNKMKVIGNSKQNCLFSYKNKWAIVIFICKRTDFVEFDPQMLNCRVNFRFCVWYWRKQLRFSLQYKCTRNFTRIFHSFWNKNFCLNKQNVSSRIFILNRKKFNKKWKKNEIAPTVTRTPVFRASTSRSTVCAMHTLFLSAQKRALCSFTIFSFILVFCTLWLFWS